MTKEITKKKLAALLSVFTVIYIILQIIICIGNDTDLSRHFWIEHKNVQELINTGLPEKSEFTSIIKFISDQHFWILRAGVILTIFLACYYKNKNKEYYILFSNIAISAVLLLIISSGLITWILKISTGKPRPYTDFFQYVHFSLSTRYHSFPSGHTTETFSYIVPFIYFVRKPYFIIISLLYGVSTVFTRVILSHHYITDVLFAIYITFIAGYIICFIVNKKRLERHTIP
ncbi:MAG: phosphatase PAP2 family protein [Spirochaetes bacterium]|nr:phosphatase PAP2 family protein [Spirochaetota bacterium]